MRDKEAMLRVSNGLSLAGTVFLALSMCTALFVVVEFVAGRALAVGTTGLLAVAFLVLWYGIPLRRRLLGADRRERE